MAYLSGLSGKAMRSLAGMALAGLACAAGGTASAGENAASRDIHIGMVNAQTGPAAALGQGMREGAQAVFSEVNADGGIHGRKIVLETADDSYEPEQTLAQTLSITENDRVLALFGYVGTPTVNAVLPLIVERGVPLIGVFSGAQSLRRPLLRQVFNVRASYDDETEMLVDQLAKEGARKIAVVYQNDGFGIAVLSGTDRALKKRGASVFATGNFQRNTLAIRFALASMFEAQPDAIVLAGPYLPVATFINQARAMGLKSRFATVSFVGTESLMALLERSPKSVLVSQVVPFPGDSDLAVTRGCRNTLRQQADVALTFVNFEGCIGARLLVWALTQAGPEPTRQDLIASLESLHQVDLGGLSVTLSPDDHQATDNVFLTEITDGRITRIR